MHWKKLDADERRAVVFGALAQNTSYHDGHVLGLPGSFLDRLVFPEGDFLQDAPFLSCMLENPNHIGCHTLGDFEPNFQGTQNLERELLRICAEELLGAEAGSYDGYVASGGTESNIEALWVFRNQFRAELGMTVNEVGVLHSADTHYSVPKAANLLDLVDIEVAVHDETRRMCSAALEDALLGAKRRGVRAIIVVANMGTTMFGSVDPLDPLLKAVEAAGLPYRVHVDAAFGGFIYPLSVDDCALSFRDPRIGSFTLDAHKMLQAPYGTGIFLARKGLMQHVQTEAARYVPGTDYTVCGSRSGANAVAVWMILSAYGSADGRAFVAELLARTDALCIRLDELGVRYFREPGMNVVTLRAGDVPASVAAEFQLVPDRHDGPPGWWKIVVMDHVDEAAVDAFVAALGAITATQDGAPLPPG
jgi:tyrosine decarboxylase / aspartate 1-decarboxylase